MNKQFYCWLCLNRYANLESCREKMEKGLRYIGRKQRRCLCVFLSRLINLGKLQQHIAMNYPLVTVRKRHKKKVFCRAFPSSAAGSGRVEADKGRVELAQSEYIKGFHFISFLLQRVN